MILGLDIGGTNTRFALTDQDGTLLTSCRVIRTITKTKVKESPMIHNWQELMEQEKKKEYFQKLQDFVEKEYASATVFPEKKNIYRALELTPLKSVKAVCLGQDPYHEPRQATGLAFSVPEGVKVPPSLVNIYKEIDREYGCGIPESGNLENWAVQGVLLLNTVLTVREHEANSHAGRGWETFTDAVIRAVAEQDRPIVFMLWGNPAQKKAGKILSSGQKHLVLKSSHPSPLSVYRGFDGCGHFRMCNDFLMAQGREPIQWNG